MQQHIQLQLPKFTNDQSPTVVVEAGHIYTNEQPTETHFAGIIYGALLAHYLDALGGQVKKWVFLDNYNPTFEEKPITLDVATYIAQISQKGYIPDSIVYEADLVTHAKEALEYLCANDYAAYNSNAKRVILKKDGIPLYNPENDKYMCALLDACLYQEKFNHAVCCVTVLENAYASQQKATATILGKLGINPEQVYPIFYTVDPLTGASTLCSSASFQNKQTPLLPSLPDALTLFIQVEKMKGTMSFAGDDVYGS